MLEGLVLVFEVMISGVITWFLIGEVEFLRAELKTIIDIATEYIIVLQCIILLRRALSSTEQGGYSYGRM